MKLHICVCSVWCRPCCPKSSDVHSIDFTSIASKCVAFFVQHHSVLISMHFQMIHIQTCVKLLNCLHSKWCQHFDALTRLAKASNYRIIWTNLRNTKWLLHIPNSYSITGEINFWQTHDHFYVCVFCHQLHLFPSFSFANIELMLWNGQQLTKAAAKIAHSDECPKMETNW